MYMTNITYLNNRIKLLEDENRILKEQIETVENKGDRMDGVLKDLEKLKDEWTYQINEINKQRKKYVDLILDVKNLRRIKRDIERSEKMI